MRDALGPKTRLGYSTNVHPGATLAALREGLERHAVAVKARVSPHEPLGLGLWIAGGAASELKAPGRAAELATWLNERGLAPFTINGFPQGDFHLARVKHRVYQPDWTTGERTRHTIALAEILAVLLGEETEGSISTLPVGWRPTIAAIPGAVEAAAANLLRVAEQLAKLEQRTGKWIHVDLEPEPGCHLDTSADLVAFFEEHLLARGDERTVRRHLGVCHDVCHAAVMFEAQEAALAAYAAAGIAVGKVQLSSAVAVAFETMDANDRRVAVERLHAFAEERYLHQTVVRRADGATEFFEDLHLALEAHGEAPRGEWRVHFHVPLGLERAGLIATTWNDVKRVVASIGTGLTTRHFETETYAWEVLPPGLREENLARSLARELEAVLALGRSAG